MRRLVVVGSVNVDLVVPVDHLPRPGETVVGGALGRHQGGKGGNQAVAAARALRGGPHGDAVALVGAVGQDAEGRAARDALVAERVDVAGLDELPDAATGVALIVVEPGGDNQIAVAAGANARIAAPTVERAVARLLSGGGVLLASLEVPVAAVAAALRAARAVRAVSVLNPAPVVAEASELLPLADVVTPNRSEAEALGLLGDMTPRAAMCVTLGADGALLRRAGRPDVRLPPPAVDAVDATGAGDTFNGVLAAGLLEERSLEDAARRAVVAAGLSVAVPGARSGMPLRAAIDAVAP